MKNLNSKIIDMFVVFVATFAVFPFIKWVGIYDHYDVLSLTKQITLGTIIGLGLIIGIKFFFITLPRLIWYKIKHDEKTS